MQGREAKWGPHHRMYVRVGSIVSNWATEKRNLTVTSVFEGSELLCEESGFELSGRRRGETG